MDAGGEVHAADESLTVRFQVRPAAEHGDGEFQVKARRRPTGTELFDRGYEVIEYPHIRRQHIYEPTAAPR